MLLATLAALLAACLFALSVALQHRSVDLVARPDKDGALGLTRFISGTLRQPLWVLGSAAEVGGFGLHALALREGPLTLVQPLLVNSVVFALVLRQALEHRRPRRSEVGWACALGLGLVLFLVISTPANAVAQPPDGVPTIVVASVVAVAVGGLLLGSRLSTGDRSAAMLGTAAGLCYAASAGLLKETVDSFDRGLVAVTTDWPLYGLLAVGTVGLLLTQLAYRAGPLSASLPAIMTVDATLSVIIGVAVFDERFRNGPIALLGEVVSLMLVTAAAVVMSRSETRAHHKRALVTQPPGPHIEQAPPTGASAMARSHPSPWAR
jgi:drug/metabolite transporter (DMT)-like permease